MLAMTTMKHSEGEIVELEIDIGMIIKDIMVVIEQIGHTHTMIEEAMSTITTRNVDFVMADLVGMLERMIDTTVLDMIKGIGTIITIEVCNCIIYLDRVYYSTLQ